MAAGMEDTNLSKLDMGDLTKYMWTNMHPLMMLLASIILHLFCDGLSRASFTPLRLNFKHILSSTA